MPKTISQYEILFEVEDVLGRKVRTTKDYWQRIITIKHRELKYGIDEAKQTLTEPNEIRQSVTDETILLYAKSFQQYDILIVVVKVLNGDGFLVTVYHTTEYKQKGKLIWSKQKSR